jgi:hypothetical protein
MRDGQTDRQKRIVVNIQFYNLFLDVNETNFPQKFSKYPQTFPDNLLIAERMPDRGTDMKN